MTDEPLTQLPRIGRPLSQAQRCSARTFAAALQPLGIEGRGKRMEFLTMSSQMTEAATSRQQTRSQPVPTVLAGAGSILLLIATFAPWYRVGPEHTSGSAWQQSPIVVVLLLVVDLVGGALAYAAASGRVLAERTLVSVFALTLATTLVVVFRLFIDRPGGNASTTLAYGGYPALLAINLVKTSAVVSLALARRRRSGGGNPRRPITADPQ
jgi:hypothetical protein